MCDNEKIALAKRARNVRLIYTVVNLYVLIPALILCFDFYPLVVEIGKLMIVGMGFIIPISTVVLWHLNKPCRTIHTKHQHIYLFASRGILVFGWAWASMMIAQFVILVISLILGILFSHV